MSLATLERAIVAGARVIMKNPKIRLKDMLEWSTGHIEDLRVDEIAVYVPDPGCWAAFKKELDKR